MTRQCGTLKHPETLDMVAPSALCARARSSSSSRGNLARARPSENVFGALDARER